MMLAPSSRQDLEFALGVGYKLGEDAGEDELVYQLGSYDNGGYSPDPSLLLREVRREAQDRMFQLYPDDPRVARARAARAAEDGDWVSARNLPWAHGMGGAHS
jgi:hypothetical protein